MNLTVTLEQCEDGYIIVECPSLPGCISQGKTEEEALANIREAIDLWLVVESEKVTEGSNKKIQKVNI